MPNTCDTLIRAGTLVTQDADRRILPDAGIAVTNGQVDSLGRWQYFRDFEALETIDLSEHIVLPGLVNTHTHAAMTVFRGLEDDLPLMEWLNTHIWPAETRLSPEIVSMGTALACAEMLATGTTTFCDLYLFEKAIARTVDTIGMRAFLGEGVFDTPNASYSTVDQAFERISELVSFCEDKGLVKPCLVAHSVYATSHNSLERLSGLARDLSLTLTLHAAETTSETAMCLERFGARPVGILQRLGLLAPNLLIAHAVDVSDAEIGLMAAHGVKVAHNPRSNMKLASGMAPVAAMRSAGITVGLGTDGAASNNALNMFSELNTAALLAKVRDLDPTALPAQAVLDMATTQGALALGQRDIGALAPGMQADLIALDANVANLNPLHNPVSHLAYSATGHEVRLTMVAGKTLYRNGRFHTIDYQALLGEMNSVRKWARGS